jgi:hypothetical protein
MLKVKDLVFCDELKGSGGFSVAVTEETEFHDVKEGYS